MYCAVKYCQVGNWPALGIEQLIIQLNQDVRSHTVLPNPTSGLLRRSTMTDGYNNTTTKTA